MTFFEKTLLFVTAFVLLMVTASLINLRRQVSTLRAEVKILQAK